jgi:hypothetical protein
VLIGERMSTILLPAHRVAVMGTAVLRPWAREPSRIAGFWCYRRYLDDGAQLEVVTVVDGRALYAADPELATDYPDEAAEMFAAPWWWLPPLSWRGTPLWPETGNRFVTAEEAMADSDRAFAAQGWVLL